VFRLFDGIESVEMHNNVFFRVGGGGVKIIQDADVSWATGSAIIAGSNNWVATNSETVPSQWTGTLTGADPTFANLVGDDLMPLAPSPLVDAGIGSTASPSGYAFPAPLAMPAYLPPPGGIQAMGGAVPRPVAGAMDIGAYELGSNGGGSSSSSSSSASSSSASSSAASGGSDSSSAATSGAGGGTQTSAGAGGAGAGDSGSGATGPSSGNGGADDPGAGNDGGRGAGDPGADDGDDVGAGGDVFLGDEDSPDASEAEPKAGMSGSCRASRGAATGPAGVIMAFAAALAFARRSRRRAAAR
jgi:hypothetical protein